LLACGGRAGNDGGMTPGLLAVFLHGLHGPGEQEWLAPLNIFLYVMFGVALGLVVVWWDRLPGFVGLGRDRKPRVLRSGGEDAGNWWADLSWPARFASPNAYAWRLRLEGDTTVRPTVTRAANGDVHLEAAVPGRVLAIEYEPGEGGRGVRSIVVG
jgi:hypothetical protein